MKWTSLYLLEKTTNKLTKNTKLYNQGDTGTDTMTAPEKTLIK